MIYMCKFDMILHFGLQDEEPFGSEVPFITFALNTDHNK